MTEPALTTEKRYSPAPISWGIPTQPSHIELIRTTLAHIEAKTYPLIGDICECPVTEFTDPQVAARERQRFFRDYPLIMGTSGDVREPGDFFTDDYCGLPILVTRNRQGQVKAFLNVCKHRGAKVADGRGRRSVFACRYHGWTYSLEGKLIGCPQDGSFAGVDRDAHSLTELPAAEKHGFIWVRPTPGGLAVDPDRLTGGLEQDFATYGIGTWHHYDNRVLRQKCNWKFAMHTFFETYHFRYLHQKNIFQVSHDLGMFEPFERNFRLWVVRRTLSELRGKPESEWSFLDHSTVVHILFPNTILVMVAGHAQLWRIFPAGNGVDECVLDFSIYTPQPAISESARSYLDTQFEFTLDAMTSEDFPCVEMGQIATASGATDHLVYGRNEPGMGYFHRQVTEAMLQAGP